VKLQVSWDLVKSYRRFERS